MARPPELPHYDACIALMRSKQGMEREDGYWYLEQQAGRYLDRLLADFEAEPELGFRRLLLRLITQAKDPRSFPLFQRLMHDEEFQDLAVEGLLALDTKQTRQLVFDAGFDRHDLPWRRPIWP